MSAQRVYERTKGGARSRARRARTYRYDMLAVGMRSALEQRGERAGLGEIPKYVSSALGRERVFGE